MIKLAVNGCCGKMGRRIMDLAFSDPDFKVVAALEKSGHAQIWAKTEGIIIADNPDLIESADVVIDFSSRLATQTILAAALKYKTAMVIGTTGLTHDDIRKLEDAASSIPVVFSPNMSVGVNLLFLLVKEAAAKLKKYRVNITEAHHVHKKDAPSGTAKRLAQIIQQQTHTAVKDIKSIREDEIIGDHEVIFESELDTLILSHSARNRDIFARGALDAARWVVNQDTGLFSMQDVLGR